MVTSAVDDGNMRGTLRYAISHAGGDRAGQVVPATMPCHVAAYPDRVLEIAFCMFFGA
jgi:hypothetical protein